MFETTQLFAFHSAIQLVDLTGSKNSPILPWNAIQSSTCPALSPCWLFACSSWCHFSFRRMCNKNGQRKQLKKKRFIWEMTSARRHLTWVPRDVFMWRCNSCTNWFDGVLLSNLSAESFTFCLHHTRKRRKWGVVWLVSQARVLRLYSRIMRIIGLDGPYVITVYAP